MARRTRRETIIDALTGAHLTPRDLSKELGMRERDIVDDLEHIKKSVGKRLKMTEPWCPRCDFVFRRRKRLNTPSRCPECRFERVEGPFFSIKRKRG